MNEATTVTLLDLLNLSLGTPEIGAVNFNLLHRFLLELVKHFSLARKQIDITDDISIQSALEETQMLSGTKSQTIFLNYSSLSDGADSKHMSELRARDSSTALESEKFDTGCELKSRDGVSGLDKFGTPASGMSGKESITEWVKPDDGNPKGKVKETAGREESLQTRHSTGEDGKGHVTEKIGSNESSKTQHGTGESRKGQAIETTGSKGSPQRRQSTVEDRKGQTMETTGCEGSFQKQQSPGEGLGGQVIETKRSTGEMKSIEETESGKNKNAEKRMKTIYGKETKEDAKPHSPYDKAQFKAESPLSRKSPQSGRNSVAGRSVSFGTKDSKRASPASSKTDLRKQSFMEMAIPGLYQLERKISILETKVESLSAAPTNLEIVQQARDLQSRNSSTTAAGDMWQAMNVVRRIEVAEGAIDGITSMLDDISEQLKKMKQNSPDGRLNELSSKLQNVIETMANLGKPSAVGNPDELQAKLAEMDERLKNIVCKPDLKSYVTTKKMNDIMDFKLQNYKQLSPTVPTSPKKTSSKLAQTEAVETSSQPVQTDTTVINIHMAQTGTAKTSGEQAPTASTTTNSEEATFENTTKTPISNKANDDDESQYGDIPNLEAAFDTADEREEENDERRGSITTEAFQELYLTMQDWCEFREEATQKMNHLEESLSNTVDKKTLMSLKHELNNLAEVQSTLKNNYQQVKDELNKLTAMQAFVQDHSLKLEPAASQHDLNKLETSVEGRLQALSKSLQEMKQNFFKLYEMNETIGNLKEAEENIKSDIENVRREITKIMKQLDDEQEARNTFAKAVGRKQSFAVGDSEEFHHLRSSLLEMKSEIEKHNTAMAHIIEDQNKKQIHLEALYSHVDQLENLKADKQVIHREIEVKADRKELEKKVSHDKFQGSLRCLDQSVQDLGEKLVGQESTLKQAINHITLDFNSKLDKMDMDTVKDYFEDKLKDLNSKVQRKPSEDKSEAAASRCMLRQPANCISCDKPVHLYREGAKLPSLPFHKPLPCGKSTRPYMTFDLGDLRRKMCDVGKPRGKDQTESLGQAKVQNELLKLGAIKEGDDFPEVSNRPCGGNHTLTCPEKRTTIRVNKAYREDLHFIAQLSQKELNIVDILGYDGHVYKGHVNQLPSIPEIPKNTMASRPTTGSGRPRTSSPI